MLPKGPQIEGRPVHAIWPLVSDMGGKRTLAI